MKAGFAGRFAAASSSTWVRGASGITTSGRALRKIMVRNPNAPRQGWSRTMPVRRGPLRAAGVRRQSAQACLRGGTEGPVAPAVPEQPRRRDGGARDAASAVEGETAAHRVLDARMSRLELQDRPRDEIGRAPC